MRKFKYTPPHSGYHLMNLTPGKVYDVIKYWEDQYDKYIILLNDINIEKKYYVVTAAGYVFKDVTEEYRNEVIDNILL